jgi:hypothetical protein
MENNKVQEIYNRLITEQAFAEKLKKFEEDKEITSPEDSAAAFIEFAKLNGYEVTIEEIKAFAEETCKPLSEEELDSVNAAGGLGTLITDAIMDNIIKKDKSLGFCLVIGAGWGYGEGFGFTVCRIIGVGEGVSWEKMGSQKNK